MSYILDALKKSEQERDNDPVHEISHTVKPAEQPKTARTKWLWLVPALLAVNIILLLWPQTTPDTGSLVVTTTNQQASTASTLLKEQTTEEYAEEQTKTDAPNSDVNNEMPTNPAPPLSPPATQATQATAKPTEQSQRYHRDPFAPMPGRVQPKPVAVLAPIQNKPRPTPKIPAPNIEKLNRSLLNQALIEQLAPLKEEQPAIQVDTVSTPDTILANRNNSPAPQPGLTESLPHENTPSTLNMQQRIPLLRELDSSLQRAIPTLNVSVHIYTEIPEQRMARINGRMTRQGQQISNGLTLKEIRPDFLILSFNGEKFRLMR